MYENILMSSEDTLKNLKVVLDGTSCTIFMTTLTIWALFADDVRLSVVDDEADALFGIVTTVVFICFVIEIIACSLADPKYLALPQWQRQSDESLLQMWQRRFSIGSFFFWLDLISTISLLLELPFMQSQVESTDGSTDSTRAGRASRAGAKASKVIKVVRMTRLVRTLKLYKYFSLSWQQQRQQEQVEQSQELSCQGLYEESKDSEETPQAQRSQILELTHNKVSMNSDGIRDVSLTTAVEEETRVGSAMTDLTSRRVILLVLVMLITIPLIMDDAETANTFHIFIVELISSLVECGTLCTDSLEGTLKMTSLEYDVVSASHGRTSFYRDENRLTELRDVELSIITAGDVIVIFDVQDASMDDATLSCFLTVFVILLLAAATYILSCDMNHTVLVPIEKMVSLVKRIAVNPLGVTYSDVKPEDGFGEGMETTLLMQTINKLGRLMKVGFGDAGTAIISAALARSEGGKINLDLTTSSGGRIVRHIFGFCDVRQFTDTTECLQEEVMLFVNRIAHILHSIVVQCGGSANKNIGDAFLLTWELDSDARGGGRRRKTVKDMYAADSALYALLISLISIHRHNSYICNFSSKATEKLYRRFSSYRVRLGCGLHVGWAVEGALGSHRKIDATYLSPHVNMSEVSTTLSILPLPLPLLLHYIQLTHLTSSLRAQRSSMGYLYSCHSHFMNYFRHKRKQNVGKLAALHLRLTSDHWVPRSPLSIRAKHYHSTHPILTCPVSMHRGATQPPTPALTLTLTQRSLVRQVLQQDSQLNPGKNIK